MMQLSRFWEHIHSQDKTEKKITMAIVLELQFSVKFNVAFCSVTRRYLFVENKTTLLHQIDRNVFFAIHFPLIEKNLDD